jgi:hypothetical protein
MRIGDPRWAGFATRVAVAIAFAGACGPSADEAAPCEDGSAVQVLRTAPDEWAKLRGKLGDRLVFDVETYQSGAPYEGGLVTTSTRTVGECGEDPREVAAGFALVAVDEVEDVLLVSGFPGPVSVLDLESGRATPVLEEWSSRSRLGERELVSADHGGTIRLVRRPLGASPAEIVGHDAIPHDFEFDFILGDGTFWVGDDELRYVDTKHRLWRVELASGAAILERAGVSEFSVADDASFVVVATWNGGRVGASVAVDVLLPALGEWRELGRGLWFYDTGPWAVLADGERVVVHDVIRAQTHALDVDVLPLAVDDERLYLYGAGELWTPATGERVRLDVDPSVLPRFAFGTLWGLEGRDDGPTGTLWRIPMDGSARLFVADRLDDWLAIEDVGLLLWRAPDEASDERVLEIFDVEEEQLRRIDVGVPRAIDSRVEFGLVGEGELLYPIARGERAGWWRVGVLGSPG